MSWTARYKQELKALTNCVVKNVKTKSDPPVACTLDKDSTDSLSEKVFFIPIIWGTSCTYIWFWYPCSPTTYLKHDLRLTFTNYYTQVLQLDFFDHAKSLAPPMVRCLNDLTRCNGTFEVLVVIIWSWHHPYHSYIPKTWSTPYLD